METGFYGLPRFAKEETMESRLNPESTDRIIQVTRSSGRLWRDMTDLSNDSNNTYIYKGSQLTNQENKPQNSKTKLYAAILIIFTLLTVSCIAVAVLSTMLYQEKNKHDDDGKNVSNQTRSSASMITTTINPTLHCQEDTPDAQDCSEGWTLDGGSCYWLNKNLLSWDMAEEACRKRSATLVEVTRDEETSFLEDFAIDYSIWVGMKVLGSGIKVNTCSQTPSRTTLLYERASGNCVEFISIFNFEMYFSYYINRNCDDYLMSVCERIF